MKRVRKCLSALIICAASLAPLSPARNTGKDAGITSDFEGDQRPWEGGYDLGADEFCYHSWVPVLEK